MLFLKVVIEVAIFTEFCDNVHVIGCLVDVMEFNDVLVVNHFHDIYLRLNIFEVVGIQENFLVDYFDCHIGSRFNGLAQIDRGVGALPNKFLQTELVLFNSFPTFHQQLTDILYNTT